MIFGADFFPRFEIYFWVGVQKNKSNGNNSVASPFGLRDGLRQSGMRLSARDYRGA
jgi:hypothetical protein